MPYKANEARRHKIPKARYRVENWAAYDAALRRRGDLAIWVSPEAIATWAPPVTGRGGRPSRYSDIAIETGLMLRLAFGRPWRQTEGLLGSLMRLLGLDLPVPDHTTFSRRSAGPAVETALARTDGPVTVIIDSTGLKVFGKGEWHLQKHGDPAAGAGGSFIWRPIPYGRRSLVEVAMLRYKVLIGRSLRARTLPAQKAEARAACAVINRMTSLGMPTSRKVA